MSITVGLDISALDSSFKQHAFRGIGRYVQELKKYFDKSPAGPVKVGSFDHRMFHAQGLLDAVIDRLPVGRHTVRQQLVYPLRLNKKDLAGFNFLHFPAHMDAPSWSVKNYIITVLDLIPIVCRDLYQAESPGWRFHLARWLELRAIKNASLVLAISESTANDAHRILGVPREKIVVTPLGVDQKFFSTERRDDPDLRTKLGIPQGREVILYLGGIDQRKNWRGMLETMRHVVGRRREAGREAPMLVMAGKTAADRQYPLLCAKIKEMELEPFVLLPGFVDDAEMMRLHGLSSLFFFPSLYEGFGLPPLEAMAAGTPVVSSNTSAMPEVIGDAALTIDPTSAEAGAKAIDSVLENAGLARELSERGRTRARGFTWERTGELTMKAYEQFANQLRQQKLGV